MPLERDFNYAQTIWRMMHTVKLKLDERLAPYGITSRQARVLSWVKAREAQGLGVRQKDIERDMGLRASSVSSLVNGLEKNGFIIRQAGSGDARTKTLELTEKSRELFGVFQEIFDWAEQVIVRGMSEGQKQMLLELMSKALQNLELEEQAAGDSNSSASN